MYFRCSVQIPFSTSGEDAESRLVSFSPLCFPPAPLQLGWPDMRLPIMYTMSFPERVPVSDKTWPRLDFTKANSLTFRAPDRCVRAGLGSGGSINLGNAGRPRVHSQFAPIVGCGF